MMSSQVVSGLVKYIPEAEMQGRRVVVLCNLKPANMRGVQSQAMVMAASSADGEKVRHSKAIVFILEQTMVSIPDWLQVELLEPPEGCQVGERLTFEGYVGEPDEQLNPKKKIFEQVCLVPSLTQSRLICLMFACQVQPDFQVNEHLVACYKEAAFMTSKGPCRVKSVAGGSIK